MLFLHIADLHFGKSLCGRSFIDNGDQAVWVRRFLQKADELKPQAVVIAGDIYDRSNPTGEAVALFDLLLTELNERGITVMAVSGNHDSGDRLCVGSRMLGKQGVHIAGRVEKNIARVTLTDEYGPVDFWLMPYFFPAAVANVLEDESIRDYDTAARRYIAAQPLDPTRRNVAVSHQNVLANGQKPERGGSETLVGGVGEIDYTAYDPFDYAALGHIHCGQAMGRNTVRYAGSPLCYHFDETVQPEKGCLLVELGPKGQIEVRKVHIPPETPLLVVKGSLDSILSEISALSEKHCLRAVLTDRPVSSGVRDTINALAQSRNCVLMELESEFRSEYHGGNGLSSGEARSRTVDELFSEFFFRQNSREPNQAENALILKAFETIRNENGGALSEEEEIRRFIAYAERQEEEA